MLVENEAILINTNKVCFYTERGEITEEYQILLLQGNGYIFRECNSVKLFCLSS